MLALAAGSLSALEAGEPDGESEFVMGLEAVRRKAQQERFAMGRTTLRELLAAHARKPYVYARRGELEELAERVVFGVKHPAPGIKDLLGKRVLSYGEKSGKVRVRYRCGYPRVLLRDEGYRFLFAPRLAGRFRVKISGPKLTHVWDNTAHVTFGGDPAPGTNRPQFWVAKFGRPTLGGGGVGGFPAQPATLTHVDGEKSRCVDSKAQPPTESGRPFRIQLDVRGKKIQVRYDGKRCLEAEKPAEVWGFLAFQARGWDEFAFDGTLDTVWVQNELNKMTQDALKRFRSKWRPNSELPAWLYKAPTSRSPETPSVARPYPDALDAEQQVLVLRVQTAVLAQDVPAARRALEAVAKRLPQATRCYVTAQVSLLGGDYARGLEEIEACLDAAPGFALGYLLAGRLLIRVERLDDALKRMKRGVDGKGAGPWAFEDAANVLLLAGRADAAKTILETARAKGVTSKALSQLERTVLRALKGPVWPRSYEVLSANYRVVSDIDKATCIEAARLLEEALTRYRVKIRWTRRQVGERFTVYLFGGRDGFRAYLEDLGVDTKQMVPGVAGMYVGSLKQLLIWNLPKREDMLETIRHEGFHQYLDRFIADAPVWLNEGLAVYYEAFERRRGRVVLGLPRPDRLAALAKRALVPLDEFLLWSPRRFYESAPQSYSQAWLLVHLLLHGESEHKELLDRLLERLETEGGAKVVGDLFPPDLVTKLDRDLAAHLEGMR